MCVRLSAPVTRLQQTLEPRRGTLTMTKVLRARWGRLKQVRFLPGLVARAFPGPYFFVPRAASRRAFDNHEITVGVFLPERPRRLIFGALVAGARGCGILELDHDVALARMAFHRLEGAAPHQESGGEFLEGR